MEAGAGRSENGVDIYFMVQLRLDGIDFSKYLIAYRQPVLDAMEWMVANAAQAAQFKFVDARGLVRRMTAFTSPADVSFYLEKILDFIKKCDSPLTAGEFCLHRPPNITRL